MTGSAFSMSGVRRTIIRHRPIPIDRMSGWPGSQIEIEMADSVFHAATDARISLPRSLHGDAAVGAIAGEIDRRLRGRQRSDDAECERTRRTGRPPEFGP